MKAELNMIMTEKLLVSMDAGEKDDFQKNILSDNIIRGKILMKLLIAFEVILAAADVLTSVLNLSNVFRFDAYLVAYSIMILVNIAYLIFLGRLNGVNTMSASRLHQIEAVLLIYVTFIQTWGSVISLMDQKLYGQLMVFMVNMIVCSVIFYLDIKQIIIPYVISTLTLVIGLPFFQKSYNILIGHYVNIFVFVVTSFLCSRILFSNYFNDYVHKSMLRKANEKLEALSLFDELTLLPNRRSYDQYTDTFAVSTSNANAQFSAIMMDIDFFKEFNDIYGHKAGDECLTKAGEQIQTAVNSSDDFAARIGGEEFVYISTSADDRQIVKIAEMIREKINDLKIPHKASTTGYLSISLGTSTVFSNSKEDLIHCVELADKALYIAKASGRNCVKTIEGDHTKIR